MEALRPNKGRTEKGGVKFIPAPTKGLVALENIAMGTPGTALILENFFPKPDTVELRAGWEQHSDTGETVPVNALMAYHGLTQNKLFAACNDTIYDVTSTSASASTITTLTSSKLVHVNFTTAGGHYLFCVNGSDTAKHYNGTAWATPSITGTTSDNFTHVNVYKNRLYFCVKNTLKFAYLPVDSIAGAASTYELGAIFSRGGNLVAMGTYTHDGGTGSDDHAVFITSQGQVALYQGSDPSDPNDWNLIGVFDTARPLGNKCMIKVGGDLYINTEMGVIPLSQALRVDAAALGTIAISNNIGPLINSDASRYRDNYGWQMIAHPKKTMAIINVPVSEGVNQRQWVMNSQTGAWCKFTNMNAVCWEVLDGVAYFGGNDGVVYEAFESASDGGSDIVGDMLTYYDHFGNNSRLKNWQMIRPVIYSQANVTPQVGLNVDYVERAPTGTISSAAANTYLWGAMTWGSFTWNGGLYLNAKWRPITDKPGYVAAVRMKVFASGNGSPLLLKVNGFDIKYEVGGVM